MSEPFDKILHYGQTLRFFDPEAVGHAVFYEDLGTVLNEHGLPGVLEQVTELIKERRPAVTVIDSFRALSAYADATEYRRFLHDLAGRLSAFPTSSFWLGEYSDDDIGVAPEFAVADAIICLSTTRSAERETRSLRVLKLRGSDFASGRTATASPRMGSTSSRGSPIRSISAATGSTARDGRPGFPPSTRCSPTATGRAPRRSASAPRAAARP